MGRYLRPLIVLVLLSSSLQARDFGTSGLSHPILEENIIEYLRGKYEGLSKEKQHDLGEKTKESFLRGIKEPRPVSGIGVSREYRKFYFDPSIDLKEDIQDQKGHVIAKKGTHVNPLDQVNWKSRLIFIDGNDKKQLAWALKQKGKCILVKGRPIDIEKKTRRAMYFDQFSFLTKKLGIKKVPSLVSQEGKRLLIEEVPDFQKEKI